MAGAKRRSDKKKGTARRRKSGYTKRKSTKKSYKKRSGSKRKAKKSKRKPRRKSRRSSEPSIAEMAFVVANHHPDAMAQDNAAALAQAAAAAQAQSMQAQPRTTAAPSMFYQAFQDINEDKSEI